MKPVQACPPSLLQEATLYEEQMPPSALHPSNITKEYFTLNMIRVNAISTPLSIVANTHAWV